MAVITFAAIDIGSSEVSMKIYEMSSRKGMKELDFVRKGIELGKESYSTGAISNNLLEELIEILQGLKTKMNEYGVDNYRACATSGLREVDNIYLYTDKILVRTGLKIEVLSNSEQRFLGYEAIASQDNSFEEFIQKSSALIDVGDGSIQVSLFDKDALVTTQNMRIGALRIHERLSDVEKRTSSYTEVVSEMIINDLRSFKKMYLKDKQIENLIFAGDTVSRYLRKQIGTDNSSIITSAQFIDYYNKIKSIPVAGLSDYLQIPHEHAHAIIPAIIIFKRFLEETGADSILLSGIDLCDGIAYEYARVNKLVKATHDFENDIVQAARNISKRYQSSKNHILGTETLALTIFDKMKSIHGLGSRERLLLQIAVILHDCGKFINMNRTSECSYSIIKDTEIIGLSHKEREIVANAVRFNTRDLIGYDELASSTDLSVEDYLLIAKLSAILRVANAMDRSHKQKFKNVRVTLKDNELIVLVDTPEDITLEKGLFSDKADFFETVFSIRPIIKQKKQLT